MKILSIVFLSLMALAPTILKAIGVAFNEVSWIVMVAPHVSVIAILSIGALISGKLEDTKRQY